VGDSAVVLALARDGALGMRDLLARADGTGQEGAGPTVGGYRATKWALVLAADILYGDLQVHLE
jgi:hypothetical protein